MNAVTPSRKPYGLLAEFETAAEIKEAAQQVRNAEEFLRGYPSVGDLPAGERREDAGECKQAEYEAYIQHRFIEGDTSATTTATPPTPATPPAAG